MVSRHHRHRSSGGTRMKRIIIQFGGTGDLAQKKLYPAYEHLMENGFDFTVLALGRRFKDREEFIKEMVDPGASAQFLNRLQYLYYDMAEPDPTAALKARIDELIDGADQVELIYY